MSSLRNEIRLRKTGLRGKSSWLRTAERHADRISRGAFALSVAFLAATAGYGAWLSGRLAPVMEGGEALAARIVVEAGFVFNDVAVIGAVHTPRDAILHALGFPSPIPSLFYDTALAREKLMSLGWIETADVRRVLPSLLEVHVLERVPIARFAHDDASVSVIDRDGRILGPETDGPFQGLWLFGGEGAAEGAAELMEAIANCPGLGDRVAKADLVAGRFWNVAFKDGLIVKLPRKVSGVALDRLEIILANPRLAQMALQAVDLRFPGKTILRLKEPSTAARNTAIASLSPLQRSSAMPGHRAM